MAASVPGPPRDDPPEETPAGRGAPGPTGEARTGKENTAAEDAVEEEAPGKEGVRKEGVRKKGVRKESRGAETESLGTMRVAEEEGAKDTGEGGAVEAGPKAELPASGAPPHERRSAAEEDAPLLKHVGALYALAQALTHTERMACRLVEATYERAVAEKAAAEEAAAGVAALDADRPEQETRIELFRLLADAAREGPEARPPRGDASQDSPSQENPSRSSVEEEGEQAGFVEAALSPERHMQHRAQAHFLARALPSAFVSLAPGHRFRLVLCEAEGLSAEEAARATGDAEHDAARKHAQARAALRDALKQMAAPPEQGFLSDDALPEDRLARALQEVARRYLASPPPALRRRVAHALARPPAAEAAATPGADRPPARREEDEPEESDAASSLASRLPRAVVALLVILAAGGFGYLATTLLAPSEPTDVAALSAERAGAITLRLRTDRAEQAEQFVRDELGRRLQVPRIQGAQLRGVGVAEVAAAEQVPVFLFRSRSSGQPIAAYAYDYAMLDRLGERLRLPAGERQQLQEEGQVVARDVGGREVLLWRHRDDIFVAVTDRADSLRSRITS